MKKNLLLLAGIFASMLPLTSSILEDGPIDESGNTPFMRMIRDGASINSLPIDVQTREACRQNKYGYTPLMLDIFAENSINLRSLIGLPGHINLADIEGNTAIFHAIQRAIRPPILTYLLADADVNRYNNDGNTLLHIAAQLSFRQYGKQMTERLLAHGARSYYCNWEGKYPYQCTNDPELRALLLSDKNKNCTLLSICMNWMRLHVVCQK